ncbi:MAG: MFS family permease [Arcticibacterium sp.]|jgi:MFS family permease
MPEQKFYKLLIIGLIVIGSVFRLIVFTVSPPSNSYDDHLEVIAEYTKDYQRPSPFQCWECYQPPLFYYVGAVAFNVSSYFGLSKNSSWKVVQAINPFLSILVLILAYNILLLFRIETKFIALAMSFLIVLPRDIFTAAMIGNDYILVFFSILTFYLYLKGLLLLRRGKKVLACFGLMVLAALLGSLSKQQGLLLYIFPVGTILYMLVQRKTLDLIVVISILMLGASISLLEEFWKYSETGVVLVSNQHHYNYAENQFPGSLNKVEFLTFRIKELYEEPFLSERTSASLPTELFARTFNDYEWRFMSPRINLIKNLGRMAYTLGLFWVLFFLWLLRFYLVRAREFLTIKNLFFFGIPAVLVIFFLAVPAIQTLRFPYFSSMKAMFILPGLIILILLMGALTKRISLTWIVPVIISVNVVFGLFLSICIWQFLNESLYHLHGPLWPIP